LLDKLLLADKGASESVFNQPASVWWSSPGFVSGVGQWLARSTKAVAAAYSERPRTIHSDEGIPWWSWCYVEACCNAVPGTSW